MCLDSIQTVQQAYLLRLNDVTLRHGAISTCVAMAGISKSRKNLFQTEFDATLTHIRNGVKKWKKWKKKKKKKHRIITVGNDDDDDDVERR